MSTIDSYDSYGVLHTNNNSGLQPSMRYAAEGAAVYRPMMPPTSPHSAAPPPTYQPGGDGSAATAADTMEIDGSGIQHTKRKRGRPRKYAVGDGSTMATPPPPSHLEAVFQSSGLSSPTTPAVASSSGKKSRGRPKGSKGRKLQRVASSMGSAGVGFTPHVITVKAGEDVSTKIMSFSQTGSSGICILSANGAISNVTLRQAATSGGTVTYEGRFEILSLSGSYMLLESGGQRSRTGGLSALLAGPDGRVLGGGVAGVLTAAAPVQVVVGCFTPGQEVLKSPNQITSPSTAPTNAVPEASAAGSPVSRGTMSESSGEPGSPLNQSTGAYDNGSNQQGMNLSWQ